MPAILYCIPARVIEITLVLFSSHFDLDSFGSCKAANLILSAIDDDGGGTGQLCHRLNKRNGQKLFNKNVIIYLHWKLLYIMCENMPF